MLDEHINVGGIAERKTKMGKLIFELNILLQVKPVFVQPLRHWFDLDVTSTMYMKSR
jgi:hypothetical protein